VSLYVFNVCTVSLYVFTADVFYMPAGENMKLRTQASFNCVAVEVYMFV